MCGVPVPFIILVALPWPGFELANFFVRQFFLLLVWVDPGGPVVIIIVTGSEVSGLKPGRGRWIFQSEKSRV